MKLVFVQWLIEFLCFCHPASFDLVGRRLFDVVHFRLEFFYFFPIGPHAKAVRRMFV